MAVNLAPVFNDAPYIDTSGDPATGYLLYTYVAGSAGATTATTYTNSGGGTPNANPMTLNAGGYPTTSGSQTQIWLTAGVSYLFILKTSAGVTVWSRDNLTGINDTTVTIDQWVTGPAPTYIGATSFSLVGDQTSTFQVGRRLKTTNSGGTIYSTISASVFGALTTVTVVNDSGTLDAGLSAVSYALLSATNPSLPFLGPTIIATQAQQETGTTLTSIVTPGRQHYSQSAVKAWASCDASGVVPGSASYNLTSITDNGPGDFSFVWATDFSSGDYLMLASAKNDTAPSAATSLVAHPIDTTTAAGVTRVQVWRASDGALTDATTVHVACLGDQA